MVSRARVRGFAGYITRFNRSTKGLKNDGSQVDIEKFDGTGDFELWRIKMCALLIQYGCEAALEVLPADIEAQAKAELNKKAHSAVILCLVSYGHFVDTLLYRREALTLVDVMAILNSKEIKERSKAKGGDSKELYVRGRNDHKGSRQSRGKSRSKSRGDGGSIQLGDNKECKIREGFIVKLKSSTVKVINDSRVVLSRIRRDNCVYSLDGHAMAGELNASVEKKGSHAQVWHKRLGHISKAGLQVLEKQGLFGKKSLGKLDFCENCDLGKSHLFSFGVGRHTTQGVIDYVHSDLWGLFLVESLGGKLYFLSIINDYSTRVWVYILRFKHKAFGKFKEWKQLVENQTGRTVKKLRTDNGLEFCNQEFEQLCVESGMTRHLQLLGSAAEWVSKKRLNNHMPEEDQTDQEDGNDEDTGDQETDQTPNLTDYQLTRDREPRTRTKPLRFQDESNMAAYAFAAAEEEDTHEPLT
ncbi:retrovirus-related pol polyprotein from transposon TNT 1-94 [Tanacetum coccineum]|uniref:Retrovirus-related pol polyprotein from transposon TNT 1-94 n=1 Tax=Tanacetum coccineum TaxID=301880 RepID=A0ABQ5DNC6_9ASTR